VAEGKIKNVRVYF